MAQIDLKNSFIYFEDGYKGPSTLPTDFLINRPPIAEPVQSTPTVISGGTLVDTQAYFWTITAINNAGETLESDEETLTISAPNQTAVLGWGAVTGATGYKVYRGTTAGNEDKLIATLGTVTTYNDTGTAGTTATPPVANTTGGYPAGIGTTAIDGGTGVILPFTRFTVASDPVEHSVTSASGSPTNSITFTPVLSVAVLNNAIITILPNQLEIKIGEGNATWTEKVARKYTLNRGVLDTVKDEDQSPLEIKIEATYEFLKASTGDVPTFEDVLKNRGEAANWLSSSDDPCEPFALDLVILYKPPCADVEDERVIFPDFRYEQLAHDLKAGTIAIDGKCNAVEPIVTRE